MSSWNDYSRYRKLPLVYYPEFDAVITSLQYCSAQTSLAACFKTAAVAVTHCASCVCPWKRFVVARGLGMRTLDIEPLRESPPQKRSAMTRVLEGSQFYLHTHTFIRNRNEPYLPLPFQYSSWYSFTDPGGTEGWVGLGVWLPIAGQFTCPCPITNAVQCRATALIEINALYTKPPSTPRLGQRSFVFHWLEQSAICHVRRWLITGRISETT